ncbi:NAD(P)-dependent oxidoreductase [Aquibium carbonis]|uniref:NAD(P)-dependent oxidoreductase n=1 Tax=Aquibium carbonis TaxID=2495581 RepID=A0A429YHU3_9HYPH|nr:NAD(P)-dependent oxidoreductase [Aquibium carbonis]RST81046.1 NAD(P)-dependent oxidoreductase [Aquibium carbonis]
MAQERIGFVGIGLMGRGMAKNILAKGYDLTILAHRRREAAEELVAFGAHEADSARELAERCDIVILCVTGSPQVEAIIHGPNGLASAGRPILIIDCSTSDPSSTVRLATELSAKGMALVDAPLSRTPKEAEAGTLDVMAGGREADIERARPVLATFAQKIVHTGPVGSGHTMKLLNNFLSLGYAAIYAEALALGAKAGLTAQVFDSVISGGRMDCGFYQTFFKYVLERDRDAHRFALANGLKDLSYLSAFANATQTPNPVGAAVRNSFALAVGTGHGEDFVPMLSDIVAELSGVVAKPSG